MAPPWLRNVPRRRKILGLGLALAVAAALVGRGVYHGSRLEPTLEPILKLPPQTILTWTDGAHAIGWSADLKEALRVDASVRRVTPYDDLSDAVWRLGAYTPGGSLTWGRLCPSPDGRWIVIQVYGASALLDAKARTVFEFPGTAPGSITWLEDSSGWLEHTITQGDGRSEWHVVPVGRAYAPRRVLAPREGITGNSVSVRAGGQEAVAWTMHYLGQVTRSRYSLTTRDPVHDRRDWRLPLAARFCTITATPDGRRACAVGMSEPSTSNAQILIDGLLTVIGRPPPASAQTRIEVWALDADHGPRRAAILPAGLGDCLVTGGQSIDPAGHNAYLISGDALYRVPLD